MAREPFNRVWTETPTAEDFDEPTNAMWDAGWRGGADQDPPEAYAQNWWQNRADYALRALERLGAMTWHADAEYQRGAIAVGSNGEKYLSVAGTESTPNMGNDPVSDGGTNWIRYYDGGPPGQVSAFAMAVPPAGWLAADGSAVSRTQYSRLFNAIGVTYGTGNGSTTFNLPDLRGEFVRGWDDGRGVDGGRALGSSQQHQFESHLHSGTTQHAGDHNHSGTTQPSGEHSHSIPTGGTRVGNSVDPGDANTNSASTDPAGSHQHNFNTSTDGSHQHNFNTSSEGGNRGGPNETRPRNVAMLYCIKY